MKRQTRDTFPLIIKKGFAVVKIYEITNRRRKDRNGKAYKIYTVSYIGPNGRTRRDFADLSKAKAEANIIARSIAGFDAQRLNLNGDDARHYQQARDMIRSTGLPLHSVAHEFKRAFDILGGAHIVEAARYYKKHVDTDLPQLSVEQVVEKFYAAKAAEGVSALYLKAIRGLLGSKELRRKFAQREYRRKHEPKAGGFADDFKCPLSSIQPEDLREHLNAKRIGLVAKSNRRRLLVTLFNFAKTQGWLRANEETAADALGTYKIKRHDVEIYTPAEIAKLLNAADSDFVPYLVLIAFGGLRREELRKGLLWESINFDRAHIIVPAAIAKTNRKRKIPMHENLLQWLAPYRMKHGAIFAHDPQRRIAQLAKASGVKWKRNALRHSFGSYRMEQTKNEGQVALEMGNSPQVVKDHYFEIVDERAARDYWAITPLPKDDHKIIAVA